MKKVHGQHLIFKMIAKDVRVVPFDGGNALLFLELLDRGNQIAIAGGAFEFLRLGSLGHALAKRFDQVRLAAFEKELNVAHRFGVDLRRGELLHARSETALDVVLQAGTRMITRQINFAGWDQEMPVNEIDDAISQVGRKERTIIDAAVLSQAAGYVHSWETLAQSELYVGIRLVVAKQNVEARLLLLDKV